jgi:hypothetical protein
VSTSTSARPTWPRASACTSASPPADAGYGTLRLDTAPFTDRARRLYRGLGFERFDGDDPVTDVPAPLRDEIVYLRRRLDDGG